jgi:CRISPR/Cas system-associated exonuclease Cas4 (RecB family)
MLNRKTSYLIYIYMHKRIRLELYENYFEMKKEINKIQQINSLNPKP